MNKSAPVGHTCPGVMDLNKDKRLFPETPSSESVTGEPTDVGDMINKYGTYNVQDTTATDNVFPLIGPLGAGITGVTLPFPPDAPEDTESEKRE